MFKPTADQQRPVTLEDLVHCANCGSAMTRLTWQYYCPNNTGPGQACDTPPADADHLLRLVVTLLVDRAMTEETIQQAIKDVQEEAGKQSEPHRLKFEDTESAIAELNRRRGLALQQVEEKEQTYSDVSDEIDQINQTTTGLAYQSLIARDELDKLEFVSDETGIRNTALDLETYLGDSSPEAVQELLDLLIQEVRVSATQALVTYTNPIPTREHPEGITTDRIALD